MLQAGLVVPIAGDAGLVVPIALSLALGHAGGHHCQWSMMTNMCWRRWIKAIPQQSSMMRSGMVRTINCHGEDNNPSLLHPAATGGVFLLCACHAFAVDLDDALSMSLMLCPSVAPFGFREVIKID